MALMAVVFQSNNNRRAAFVVERFRQFEHRLMRLAVMWMNAPMRVRLTVDGGGDAPAGVTVRGRCP